MTRVGPTHPLACQAILAGEACIYKRVSESTFCEIHGGANKKINAERVALKNYVINSEYGRRAAEMARSPHLKCLTDEIVLNRVALEAVFQKIQSTDDMLIYNDRIIALTSNIMRLMETTQKIQERNKELFDRPTIMSLAESFIAIISEHVNDPDVVGKIGSGIYESIVARLSGPNEGLPTA